MRMEGRVKMKYSGFGKTVFESQISVTYWVWTLGQLTALCLGLLIFKMGVIRYPLSLSFNENKVRSCM